MAWWRKAPTVKSSKRPKITRSVRGIWLTPGNHNFLRITRILRSMTLLGLGKRGRTNLYDVAWTELPAEAGNTFGSSGILTRSGRRRLIQIQCLFFLNAYIYFASRPGSKRTLIFLVYAPAGSVLPPVYADGPGAGAGRGRRHRHRRCRRSARIPAAWSYRHVRARCHRRVHDDRSVTARRTARCRWPRSGEMRSANASSRSAPKRA